MRSSGYGPLEACGQSSRDHEVPDVIREGYFRMACVSGIRETLSTGASYLRWFLYLFVGIFLPWESTSSTDS